MAMTAEDVVNVALRSGAVQGVIDSTWCYIQHVSKRNADGPDERLDSCPCARVWAPGQVDALDEATRKLLELGGGQYISSPTHTIGDLMRDVAGG